MDYPLDVALGEHAHRIALRLGNGNELATIRPNTAAFGLNRGARLSE